MVKGLLLHYHYIWLKSMVEILKRKIFVGCCSLRINLRMSKLS